MSNPANLFMAGMPLFTVRDSLNLHRTGGVTVSPAANGRSVGQRNESRVTGITAQVYPTVDADASLLKTLLRTGGVMPVITPDGTRYACAPSAGGHGIQGDYVLGNDSYSVNWDTVPLACLADVPWRGSYPGEFGYCRYRSLTPYAASAGWSLTPNFGWGVTGTGTYGDRWMKEAGVDPLPRPQAVLIADISLPVGVRMAVGLGDTSQAVSTAALPASALGLEITSTTFNVLAPGVTTSVARVNSAIRYKIVLVARPLSARLTVWSGQNRVLLLPAIPFAPPTVPLGPFLNIKDGAVTLRGWSVFSQ